MRFICALRNQREGNQCGEVFYSWSDLADHMNADHRLRYWIAGGTIKQQDLRADHRRRKEICGNQTKMAAWARDRWAAIA